MLGSARAKRGLPGRRLVEPGGSVQAGQTSLCYDGDFYPFGGERIITNTCSQNYKFEGKERDTETGNDDFGARYYTSRLGRWLSADWSAVPADPTGAAGICRTSNWGFEPSLQGCEGTTAARRLPRTRCVRPADLINPGTDLRCFCFHGVKNLGTLREQSPSIKP